MKYSTAGVKIIAAISGDEGSSEMSATAKKLSHYKTRERNSFYCKLSRFPVNLPLSLNGEPPSVLNGLSCRGAEARESFTVQEER